ncbi:hypothetical protein HRH59_11740 [Rheinheimera sp. YQF-2]|uniref:Uncharacterized protein n=1 Tax=Rheinheimera lutimaris TaxID=2740584 RepID=A0A7Y5EI66_9GAMM|nr:hypothetical protein [Rheinheimera lutimaris]NRQ43215.1 hypothetical protein [Rheinheimera lutimaris]
MLKKNLALSVVYALTLAGLTACGGGSDSGTEAPVAVSPPTPTPTPEDVLPEFASATYVRENMGQLTEVVLLGEDLYYVSFSEEGNLLGHFTQINEHIVDGKIVEAAGFYKMFVDTALKAGQFSAELTVSNNIVDSMTSLTLESTSGPGSEMVISGGILRTVINIVDISAMNDDWVAADFSEFNIDAGLNLTAVDKDNCKISGPLTLQDNNVFAASLSYSECDAAGQYEGVLWSYSFDGVTYLKWFALDNENNTVTGLLDDFTSQQDSLALTGELQPVFYAGSLGSTLISKGNKVYYNGGDVGGQYVFTYPAPATVSVLEAEGEGLTWPTNTAVGASLTMPVPKSKNHRLSGEILLSNDNEESFSGLQAVAQSSLLATVTGSWDEMIIAEDGTVSGNIAGCVISSGAVTNYVASIADMQLTLTGCGSAGDFTGVAVGAIASNGEAIFLNLFRESGGSVVNNINGSLLRD